MHRVDGRHDLGWGDGLPGRVVPDEELGHVRVMVGGRVAVTVGGRVAVEFGEEDTAVEPMDTMGLEIASDRRLSESHALAVIRAVDVRVAAPARFADPAATTPTASPPVEQEARR